MKRLRRHLAFVASFWLAAQCALLTVTPLSLCMITSAAEDEPSCTCAHGGDASCPMHHPSAPSQSDCRCRGGALDPSTGAVAAMLGHTAILSNVRHTLAPHSSSTVA